MFGNKVDNVARQGWHDAYEDMEKLKLRLFGFGNTRCLNVSTSDFTNSILGGHRARIHALECEVDALKDAIKELQSKKKTTIKKKRK